ncbi:MAG: hypothetical protein ACOX4I_03345 [Anaerovoracaceae bacterium]|jgi:hypothetical protein
MVKEYTAQTLRARSDVRDDLDYIREAFGLSFSDIMEDENLKLQLLDPSPFYGEGKVQTAKSPVRYAICRNIVENEILPDISLYEILKQETMVRSYSSWDESLDKKGKAVARNECDHLDYFKYIHEE